MLHDLITENGWHKCDAVDCDTSVIPGTDISIPTRAGAATTVLKCWAAWFNQNVEPLRKGQCGGWTPTNSVWNSNHLAGTAIDLNWELHPFYEYTFTSQQIAQIEYGLKLFQDCVFWGAHWSTPHDEMHFQLNFEEGDQRIEALADRLRNGYLGVFTAQPIITDTIYCDVSEWQVPVDDSYPYRVLAIRSNDGTYRDKKWASNYRWVKKATDEGRLAFFIVYFVWRENWVETVNTLKDQIGTPHPKMAIMMDVESWGGQITGNQSQGINNAYWSIANWLGDPRRIIGYGNISDLNNLWPIKPAGIRLTVAAYGTNPDYPGKISHQYTDGQGYGGGLPEGAPPFGNCDVNSADGLSPEQFAQALGIETDLPPEGDEMTPEQDRMLRALYEAFCAPISSGARYKTDGEGPIWTRAQLLSNDDAMIYDDAVEAKAIEGNQKCIALVKRQVERGDEWAITAWNNIPEEFKNGVTVSKAEQAARQKSEQESVQEILDRIAHEK